MTEPDINAKAIFLQALELTIVTERDSYVETQCGSNADLRREVDNLLRHSGAVGSFLESPPTAVVDSADQLRTTAAQLPSLGFLAPSSRPDSLGRLGHYEVLEVVGSGGMGVVLKAHDTQLQRIVAIKAMAPTLAAAASGRQRFIREAQAAAAVNHDNIVDIYAVDEHDPIPYLVMEFIGGISLEDKLKQRSPLELKEILRIGLQTADGLAAAHRQGLVHRDVKPANIMLENGVGRVKITDFGLARAAADVSVTQTGVIAGTPGYMSPEQARGDGIDYRSDLFSLGSVLYTMCAGRTPFRGSTSLGVLKRVCDEAPHPIRDLNPDIPEWLCAIIERLHAKLPEDRFQSAAELAETLGCYLAHVQQPSNPLPTAIMLAAPKNTKPMNAAHSRRYARRRWEIAAVVALVVLSVTLGITDASGITQVASTIIRILTPDGTLVVETGDPAVKVTIQGDGDLTIIGAGLEEIRLKPGSYKLQADKYGQKVPLERELVSIAKGGREVVRVKLETPPSSSASKAEQGAFILLGGQGAAERQFDTLAEAIQRASDGDTIEVRGNGPFITRPTRVGKTSLTIRAGQGFRPVIRLDIEHARADVTLLETNSSLRLAGIELQAIGRPSREATPPWNNLVQAVGADARLFVVNCRFVQANGLPIRVSGAAVLDVRNSLFATAGSVNYSSARVMFHNNLIASDPFGLCCSLFHPNVPDVAIDLEHNTLVASVAVQFYLDRMPDTVEEKARQAVKTTRIGATGNVFDGMHSVLRFEQSSGFVHENKRLSVPEMETMLRTIVDWRGGRNGFPDGARLFDPAVDGMHLSPTRPSKTVADWDAFWGSADLGSVQGQIRYAGGNLLERARTAPESLTPEDFRLRPDSAGYRAGPDGKDLGADIDLVGPGPAYERWTKTPQYQQWLKDTRPAK